MLGDWLNDGTPVAEVGAFVEWIFLNLNLNGFRGELQFVQNARTGDPLLIAKRNQHSVCMVRGIGCERGRKEALE